MRRWGGGTGVKRWEVRGEAEGQGLEDTESLCTSRHKTLPSFFSSFLLISTFSASFSKVKLLSFSRKHTHTLTTPSP